MALAMSQSFPKNYASNCQSQRTFFLSVIYRGGEVLFFCKYISRKSRSTPYYHTTVRQPAAFLPFFQVYQTNGV